MGLRRAALFSVTLAALAGCVKDEPAEICSAEQIARPPPPTELTRIDARGRFIDAAGRPYLPRGLNSYPLLDHAGRSRMDAVEAILERAIDLERPLVRTHAFLDEPDHPGRTRNADLSAREEGLVALDRVVAAASRRGVRLLLTLSNHWSDYGGAAAVLRSLDPGLPKSAFYSDERAVAAQLRYVRQLVARTNTVSGARYADDPTIFAWELVNEAHCDDPGFCEDDTLVRWARAMAEGVRAEGARQPIAWGGIGFQGRHGERFEALCEDGAIDIMTLHVYPSLTAAGRQGDGETAVAEAIARGSRTIRDRAALAHLHGRAMIVEEAGWRPTRGECADQERARVLGSWARVARASGVAVWPWMIGEPDRPDYDGFLIDPDREPLTARVLRCE